MSKTDELRAMREAKYARAAAAQSGQPQAQSKAEPKTPAKKPAKSAPVAPEAAVTPKTEADGLCGHRSMNGRSCTREAGHAAKSHRYS